MAEFSITRAAMFGLSFLHRAPTTFLILAVLHAIAWQIGAQALATYLSAAQATSAGVTAPTVGGMSQLLAVIGPFLAFLVVGLATRGAILRALVRDHVGGWLAGLAFGPDEFRLLISMVLAWFAALAVFAGVGGLGGAAFALAPSLAGLDEGIASLGQSASMAIGIVLAVFIAVRLTPAPAATIGERKVVVLRAWSVSELCFWELALSFILFAVIGVIGMSGLVVIVWLLGVDLVTPSGGLFDITGWLALVAATPTLVAVLSVGALCVSAAQAGVGAYAFRVVGREAGFVSATEP